jgi:membrane associated rhomboid family serine protease
VRPPGQQVQLGFPRPSRLIIAIMAANVIAYVLELVLLRANVSWVGDLFLTPASVFERGYVWQVISYWWLHDPRTPTHLVFNMLWLYWLGPELERWWGTKRFVWAYFVFALGGAIFTLLVGLLSRTEVLAPLLGGFWLKPHVGASGAVMGVTVAWGITFADKTINLLFLGQMKGRTLMWLLIAFELLVALSFQDVSSTSHFGGMIAAAILCKGLWRPARWREMFKRYELEARRRRIENELRVIEGGGGAPPPPKNGKPKKSDLN